MSLSRKNLLSGDSELGFEGKKGTLDRDSKPRGPPEYTQQHYQLGVMMSRICHAS
jgi:hypothetical protein